MKKINFLTANTISRTVLLIFFTLMLTSGVAHAAAPTLAVETQVPGWTNNTTPDFTFTSDQAGTITYGGDCSSSTTAAVNGSNTVTLALSAGFPIKKSYSDLVDVTIYTIYSDCTVTVTNSANEASSTLFVPSFNVDTLAPVAEVNYPFQNMTIAVGDVYTSPGISTFNEIGASFMTVVEEGTVDTANQGVYPITFSVIDPAGNTGTIGAGEFQVTVRPFSEFETQSNLLTHIETLNANTSGATLTDNAKIGSQIALSGNSLFLGAPYDSTVATLTRDGAVHVFTKGTSGWTYTDVIGKDDFPLAIANLFKSYYALGTSVEATDDMLFMGAPKQGTVDSKYSQWGSAHIFTKDQNGIWEYSESIFPNAASGSEVYKVKKNESFGEGIATNGTELYISAHAKNPTSTSTLQIGAVYIFTRDGQNGDWAYAGLVGLGTDDIAGTEGLNLEEFDRFGTEVALYGNTLVVGANGDDVGDLKNAGAVYFFTKNEQDNWVYDSVIDATSQEFTTNGYEIKARDEIGKSVSIYGDKLAIGSQRDDLVGNNRGAVYLFKKEGGVWKLKERIGYGINGLRFKDHDAFGAGVLLTEDTLFVGATGDDTGGSDRGAVYIFSLISGPELLAITKEEGGKKRFTFGVEIGATSETQVLAPVFGGDCSVFSTGSTWTVNPSSASQTFTMKVKVSPGTYSGCTIALSNLEGATSSALTFAEFTVKKGGGGGGRVSSGGGTRAPSLPVMKTTSQVSQVQNRVVIPEVVQVPGVAAREAGVTEYALGSSSEDVRQAQIALNRTDCRVAQEGSGSSGSETTYFGTRTQAAIVCFQRVNNMTVTGTLNAETQDLLLPTTEQQTEVQSEEEVLQSLRERIEELIRRIETLTEQ